MFFFNEKFGTIFLNIKKIIYPCVIEKFLCTFATNIFLTIKRNGKTNKRTD